MCGNSALRFVFPSLPRNLTFHRTRTQSYEAECNGARVGSKRRRRRRPPSGKSRNRRRRRRPRQSSPARPRGRSGQFEVRGARVSPSPRSRIDSDFSFAFLDSFRCDWVARARGESGEFVFRDGGGRRFFRCGFLARIAERWCIVVNARWCLCRPEIERRESFCQVAVCFASACCNRTRKSCVIGAVLGSCSDLVLTLVVFVSNLVCPSGE